MKSKIITSSNIRIRERKYGSNINITTICCSKCLAVIMPALRSCLTHRRSWVQAPKEPHTLHTGTSSCILCGLQRLLLWTSQCRTNKGPNSKVWWTTQNDKASHSWPTGLEYICDVEHIELLCLCTVLNKQIPSGIRRHITTLLWSLNYDLTLRIWNYCQISAGVYSCASHWRRIMSVHVCLWYKLLSLSVWSDSLQKHWGSFRRRHRGSSWYTGDMLMKSVVKCCPWCWISLAGKWSSVSQLI